MDNAGLASSTIRNSGTIHVDQQQTRSISAGPGSLTNTGTLRSTTGHRGAVRQWRQPPLTKLRARSPAAAPPRCSSAPATNTLILDNRLEHHRQCRRQCRRDQQTWSCRAPASLPTNLVNFQRQPDPQRHQMDSAVERRLQQHDD